MTNHELVWLPWASMTIHSHTNYSKVCMNRSSPTLRLLINVTTPRNRFLMKYFSLFSFSFVLFRPFSFCFSDFFVKFQISIGHGWGGRHGRTERHGRAPAVANWNLKFFKLGLESSKTAGTRLKTIRNDPKTVRNRPKPSENGPKPSENGPKPSETVQNRPKPSENNPKPSENGPKPSEIIGKVFRIAVNCRGGRNCHELL